MARTRSGSAAISGGDGCSAFFMGKNWLAYAEMDVLVFPSRTDTYGNVVWEAAASGVPAVVTDRGGPRHIVRHGRPGLVRRSASEFVRNCVALI